MTEEQQKHVEYLANSFAKVQVSIGETIERAKMLEDMIIYNTNMTKHDITNLYNEIMRNPHRVVFPNLSSEIYITFLSDFIDCNFDDEALRIMHEL